MNRRYKRNKKNSKVKELILLHLEENYKYYIIFIMIFIIGLIVGVSFINNANQEQKNEITTYITNNISTIKEKSVSDFCLLKSSLKVNLILAIILWFMGSTVVGIIGVGTVIGFRGFCFGYTLSAIVATYGFGKGFLFLFSSLFIQNLIFIPSIIALAVSGAKFCRNILRREKTSNTKIELVKHSLFCAFISLLLILSSLIEIYISKNILIFFANYF